MADEKNFSLSGIGSNVQIGKGGGRVKFSTDHIEARNAADSGFIDVYVPLTPGNDQAAASKSYVDSFTASIDAKDSVRVATTADGPFATAYDNGSSVDGIALNTGDRILLKDQSDQTENGLYTVNASGPPTRSVDANTDAEVTQGAYVFVVEGIQHAKKTFILTTSDPITLDVTNQVWEVTGGGGAGGNSFGIVTGDTGTATADAATDTLQLQGATNGGITTVGSDAPELITFGLTPVDLATTGATIAGSDFLIVSDSTDSSTTVAQKVTFTSAFNDLGVPFTGGTLDLDNIDIKLSVTVTTTANITLSGEQTIDGVLTSTDRILVKDQSTSSENGIYVTAVGAWSRATDSDADVNVTQGNIVFVSEGTVSAKFSYILTTADPITVGSTAQVWEQSGGGGGATAIDDLTDVDTSTVSPGQGQTLGWDGANWIPASANALEVGQSDLLHVRDEKTSATAGGGSTAATWNVRDLNTTLTNQIAGASITSNQIILPTGTYHISAIAPAYRTDEHQLRLQNITDATTVLVGSHAWANNIAADAEMTHAFLEGRFTIVVQKTFELQHFTEDTQATNGLGVPANTGAVGVFADVQIRKITPVQTVAGLPFKGALLQLDSDFAIPDASTTTVNWDSTTYDTSNFWSAVNANRLTVPAGVTKVRVTAGLSLSPWVSGNRFLGVIRKNGDDTERGGGISEFTDLSSGQPAITITTGVLEVVEGDWFEARVFQDSAGAETLPGGATARSGFNWFFIEAVEATAPSAKPRGALVNRTSVFSVPNNSTTTIDFNNEVYDTDNIHDNLTNPERLTVPAGVTHVQLTAYTQVNSNTTGHRLILILKNGATFPGMTEQNFGASGIGLQRLMCATGVLEVVTGDFFEMQVFQNSGAARNIGTTTEDLSFSMEIVEPAVIIGDLFFDSTIQTTDATKVNIVRGLLAAGEVSTIFAEGQGIETATGDVYWFTISGAVKNISGTTSLVGTASITEDFDTNAASWTVGLEADDTADAWELTVTGQASKTIEWKISHKEVKQ